MLKYIVLIAIVVVSVLVWNRNAVDQRKVREEREREERERPEKLRAQQVEQAMREYARASAFDQALNSIPSAEIAVSDETVDRHLLENMPEIKFTNITRQTNLEKLFPLVAIDTETTGLNPRKHDIIEVSAIKFDVGFKPISCYTTLLKPHGKIPAEASSVNNITDEMVKDCPTFQQIAADFAEYISGCNIVGHNLMFDLRFLYAGGMDIPKNVKYYDTMDLAKKVLIAEGKKIYDHHAGTYQKSEEFDVTDYKLVTLCDYYQIIRSDAHRSLSDSFATAKVFSALIDDKTS